MEVKTPEKNVPQAEKGKMLGTLQLEETDLEKLQRIAQNRGQSAKDFIHEFLQSQEDVSPPKGKWAKVMEDIESLNISNETTDFIRKCSKELREEW